jgi:hypothetical protein
MILCARGTRTTICLYGWCRKGFRMSAGSMHVNGVLEVRFGIYFV